VCCPITRQQKGYPFEVALPPASAASGELPVPSWSITCEASTGNSGALSMRGTQRRDVVHQVKQVLASLLQLPE
jgi:mRNA-degrading endonuclease toxin of MazEF toxin-antitoxin module